MMFKATLRQNGHSLGLILPSEVLTHLGATKGDTVFLTFMTDGAVHLSRADPEFEAKVKAAEELNRQYSDAIRPLIRTEAEFAHYLRCNCDPPWYLEKRR